MIPVIILTTSDNPADILKSYQLHANCYLQKPYNPAELERLLKVLEEFWFHTAMLPGGQLINQ